MSCFIILHQSNMKHFTLKLEMEDTFLVFMTIVKPAVTLITVISNPDNIHCTPFTPAIFSLIGAAHYHCLPLYGRRRLKQKVVMVSGFVILCQTCHVQRDLCCLKTGNGR